MCGIAGIFTKGSTVNRDQLSMMAGALRHRGPDDTGLHLDGALGLAHTRLSIIDIGGGHQPLFSPDRHLALVANGEIYNYIELREQLIKLDCRFASHSDSETILHAYATYGMEFLNHLNGMFAFALFDASRQQLILARDRLGIKPLYYLALPDRVAFASEIKALIPLLPGRPEINPASLIQFLQSQFDCGENTIIKGIKRVPPGEVLVIDAKLNIRKSRYWSALETSTCNYDFNQASEVFDDLMATVMREHMRSDVPYGLFLSGGVDSAILLAMLDRYQDQPVRSFSVGYSKVKMKDELSDAERIARQFNTQHVPLELDQSTIFNRLPHSVWAADDLMRDYACLPTSILAERAGQELKVVFTGEGGDEVFAGYGRYRKSSLERWLKNMIAPGSGGFRTRGQWRWPWPARVFGPELKAAANEVRAPFINAWQSSPAGWSDIQKSQYTDLVTALPDNLLVKADRMLMGFALEGRVPFLDHRIVEFGLSLPDELKVQGRQGKVFLKRWAERYLPKDHLYRKKRGFHVPVGEWLKGAFLDRLEHKLIHNAAIQAWFRPNGVKQLFARQRSGHNASREIWCLMQFAIWHRLFIEQIGPRPGPNEDPLDWIS